MQNFFHFSEKTESAALKALENTKSRFEEIDRLTEHNQQKVLAAFINHRISESHFVPTTGYGYSDRGRDVLEKLFAECVGAEDALMRHSFASGTHTLTVALFGILRPGDTMLCITGKPYDTLLGVLGYEGKASDGSLAEFGINYEEISLIGAGYFDFDSIRQKVTQKKYKMVYIQRSRGYALRRSLTVDEIGQAARLVKEFSPETIVMVDNCYGEFAETLEPCDVGADLTAGSLIKNPGGGIAPSGGYIAGKSELVEKCAQRMTAPGVGREVGASLGHTRALYMGLFQAPHVTGEALKTAVFTAELMKILGYGVSPEAAEERADIIQCIKLRSKEALVAFCRGLQSGAPIDSHVVPEAWDMPGYDSQVIMAAGAFTGGSSIELSADAPLREPFAVWLQGGLHFHSAKTAVMLAADRVISAESTR